MKHEKERKHLEETYGEIAVKLDQLTDEVSDNFDKGLTGGPSTKNLYDFCESTDIRGVVDRLSLDKFAYSRELAAITIWDLWIAFEADFDSKWGAEDESYDQHIERGRLESKKLKWTEELICRLLEDKCVGPARLAAECLWNMQFASTPAVLRLRELLPEVFSKNKNKDVRLAIIRNFSQLYSIDENIQLLVGEPIIDMLIEGTRSEDYDVRNWSCFTFWNSIDNLSPKIERALDDVLRSEPYNNEIYMEAITALARFGRKDIENIICAQLATGDCKIGWMDAVLKSESTECVLALVKLYEDTLKEPDQDGIDVLWYEAAEFAFMQWNA